MSLYQKPGRDSTEFKYTMASLIAAGFVVPAGGVFVEKGHFWIGVGLMGASTLIATAFSISYTLGRSRVKAAAEMAKPPPSRVV